MQVFACLYCTHAGVYLPLKFCRQEMQMKEMDKVFKALADPSRRELLDRLHARNGQTLSELCKGLDMARQSITQHLGLLEDANLISVQRQGREKLHYFNPVPIHEIYERWIRKFEQERLEVLHKFKAKLERK
jgi:DNA-binding transcriptional ArsR family regulator